MEVNKTTQENREELFIRLYTEAFPSFASYTSKRGGNLEETRDVFQEAVLVFYERVIIDGLRPEKGDKAYLVGTAKNIWLKLQRDSIGTADLDQLDLVAEKEESIRTEKLLGMIKATGAKCMELLQSFYYEKLSMNLMAERFGFRSERSATVQKFKCLEKIRSDVKQKSLTYEDFIA